MALDSERVPGHRIRPVRRSRWRAYAPSLAALGLGLGLIAASQPVAGSGSRLTLGPHASATFATILAVLLVTVIAALCDRSPVRWYIAGALAVSVGANLAPPRWVAGPLALFGLLGLLVQEIRRLFDGITLGASAITLHRPLKDPFTVGHEDLQAVHTTPAVDEAGTLILETEHGTVTALDVPDVEEVQARIEARTSTFEMDDPEATARRARERIDKLVRGKTPT